LLVLAGGMGTFLTKLNNSEETRRRIIVGILGQASRSGERSELASIDEWSKAGFSSLQAKAPSADL
jgi:hypothetical protein